MINILFYHANDTINASVHNKDLWLGTSALYLKTYIDHNHALMSAEINWMLPKQRKLSNAELIDFCKENDVDLLCTSHYIWNHQFLLDQLAEIRLHLPTIKFVAGGPSVDVHINEEFFTKYPFIDYAIYGSGEFAFADLIATLLDDKKLILFNTSNIAWVDGTKNKTVVASFKYVPQSKVSPFCSNKDLFSRMVGQEQADGTRVILPYDLTRGCPYSCTFCDWNSGLSNKVTRRKETFQDEIDLFQNLGIKDIYLSDANVGQYQEDIDMITYLAKKNLEENAEFKIDGNFSKLRVENNLKIFHLAAQGNLMNPSWGFMIPVQDINQTVLENIARPDIGWKKYTEVITELTTTYPHITPVVQLIQGLPGQTVDSWRKSLSQVIQYDVKICVYMSELLPASPAATDPLYQEKYNFTYSYSERFGGKECFHGIFPESCMSFTKDNVIDMTMLTMMYSSLANLKIVNNIVKDIDIEYLIDTFIASSHYKKLRNNLYNNWYHEDKFYFTIDFSGREHKKVSACASISTANSWSLNPAFLYFVAKYSGINYKIFIDSNNIASNKNPESEHDTIN
jgi:hypothetical protein